MRLHKTPKAREMLTRNGPELSPLERRILILCDGRRELAALLKMLGPEAVSSVEVMRRQGFLDASGPVTTAAATVLHVDEVRAPGLMRGLNRLLGHGSRRMTVADSPSFPVPASCATASAGQMHETMPALAGTTVAASPSSSRAATRSSVSAAKMYMLDMLQLQRSLEAASIAVSIQTSTGEDALVEALLEGLAYLATAMKPGMSARIAARLAEILPDSHLVALDRCWAEVAPRTDATPTNVIPMERYA